jgi:hypothetical protein
LEPPLLPLEPPLLPLEPPLLPLELPLLAVELPLLPVALPLPLDTFVAALPVDALVEFDEPLPVDPLPDPPLPDPPLADPPLPDPPLPDPPLPDPLLLEAVLVAPLALTVPLPLISPASEVPATLGWPPFTDARSDLSWEAARSCRSWAVVALV